MDFYVKYREEAIEVFSVLYYYEEYSGAVTEMRMVWLKECTANIRI